MIVNNYSFIFHILHKIFIVYKKDIRINTKKKEIIFLGNTNVGPPKVTRLFP